MARATPLSFRPPSPAQEGLPPTREKGRGARSNLSGRYEAERREEVADGWQDEPPPPARTKVTIERPRKIVTFNNSPYVGFDRSINPYRGCEHGCIYCFARPTHAYMGLSPGLDFETRLFAKPDADRLLEKELANPRYRPDMIMIGTNTDAYQPVERHYLLMRKILGVLARFNHPVAILTKADLILRDIDLLAPMAERGLVRCMLSITTDDRRLARAMEPRATTPGRRFEAVRQLAAAGIPTEPKVASTCWLSEGEFVRLYRWLDCPDAPVLLPHCRAIRLVMPAGPPVEEIAKLQVDQWNAAERIIDWSRYWKPDLTRTRREAGLVTRQAPESSAMVPWEKAWSTRAWTASVARPCPQKGSPSQ